MPLIKKINQFISLFLDTLKQVPRWRIWLVLMALFAAYWMILFAHVKYVAPVCYFVLTPWLRLFGPNEAVAFSHYPQQFFYLANVFGWAKLAVGLIFEGLALGVAAQLFAGAYRAEPESKSGRSFTGLWLNLVGVWVVLNGLTVLAGYVLPLLAGPYLDGPRRVLAFGFVVMPFVFTLVFSLMLFAIPFVAVRGKTAWQAIGSSLRVFAHRPFMCFFLSAILLAVPLLIGAVSSRPVALIDRFKPELIYWLLLVSLAAEMIAGFFWMGTTVRFLTEPEE